MDISGCNPSSSTNHTSLSSTALKFRAKIHSLCKNTFQSSTEAKMRLQLSEFDQLSVYFPMFFVGNSFFIWLRLRSLLSHGRRIHAFYHRSKKYPRTDGDTRSLLQKQERTRGLMMLHGRYYWIKSTRGLMTVLGHYFRNKSTPELMILHSYYYRNISTLGQIEKYGNEEMYTWAMSIKLKNPNLSINKHAVLAGRSMAFASCWAQIGSIHAVTNHKTDPHHWTLNDRTHQGAHRGTCQSSSPPAMSCWLQQEKHCH